MLISHFHIHLVERAFDGKASNPKIIWTRKQAVFIELITCEGEIGWGECWTFDQSADALIRFVQTEIRPFIVGSDVSSIEDIWARVSDSTAISGRHGMMAAGLSGVDCALWDIAAQREGLSVSELIATDGTIRKTVPVYASGGLYKKGETLDGLRDVMRGYVADGHNRVKMKFGALSMDDDLLRIQAAREALGSDVRLILDAVYSLDKEKARAWLPHWKNLGIEAIQAPFRADDWSTMRWLNRDCGVPVMVFESECRLEIFRALLDYDAIGIVQFSPIAIGGITPSIKLLKMAEEFGRKVSLQCSSTWFVEAISIQLAAAHQNVAHVELHQFHQMLFDMADPKNTKVEGGQVPVSQNGSFGFNVPKELLTHCDHDLPDLSQIIKKNVPNDKKVV